LQIGRPGCPRETSRGGVIPDAVVLTLSVSGPPPAPGLDHAVQDVRPQGCITNCRRFFQGCIGNVHLSGKGPKAGVLTKGKEGLTPGEIVLSSRPTPSWARGRPGTPTPRASGKAPGKGPTERIQGVSGTAAGGSGTGAPENQWGRVNSKPHEPHSASSCGISRTGVSLRCRRRETGAVGDRLIQFFRRMHRKCPKVRGRGRFPGDGKRPTAHHRLKIPQEVLGLFPHTPMR